MGLFNRTSNKSHFRSLIAARKARAQAELEIEAAECSFLHSMGWSSVNDAFWYKTDPNDTVQRHRATEMAIVELTESLL